MNEPSFVAIARWDDACLAAHLLAVDPLGLGGIHIRSAAGPLRQAWLDLYCGLAAGPVRRLPSHINDERLIGGIDLAATLRTRRTVGQRGLLSEVDGGSLIIPMAERLTPALAARIVAAFDQREVSVERDGISLRDPTRFALIALDEGIDEAERLPDSLADRVAIKIDLDGLRPASFVAETGGTTETAASVSQARSRLAAIRAPSESFVEAICGVGMALGVASIRAPFLALRTACASAALAGRTEIDESDVAVAARLVLAPRATMMPQAPAEGQEPEEPAKDDTPADEETVEPSPEEVGELLLAAVRATLPPGLLESEADRAVSRGSAAESGAGLRQASPQRGRPIGVRAAPLRSGRLDVVATLRAAAPWQEIRRGEDGPSNNSSGVKRIHVRTSDFRIKRFQDRLARTVIFIVDASGSTAVQRLAEAKGAVEILLSEAYVRRDKVAVIAFRGSAAEVLLPPTRSLVRARKSLAAMPGGGGTPLAAGLALGMEMAVELRRHGTTPLLVVLTDGRANIVRDGTADRVRAMEESLALSRRIAQEKFLGIVIDTSPRPQEPARRMADAMQARYLPLPRAQAESVSAAVRETLDAGMAVS